MKKRGIEILILGLLVIPFLIFLFDNVSAQSCGSVEICGNGADDNCNFAIDSEEDDCYTRGKIYYLSSSLGSDGWSGKAPIWNGTDGPWKNKSILKGYVTTGSASPGDKFLFKRGDIFLQGDSLINGTDIRKSGNSSDWITFGAYGEGSPPKLLGTGGNGIFVLSTNAITKYISFEGFHFFNNSRGIRVSGSQTVSNNNIRVINSIFESDQTGIETHESFNWILYNNTFINFEDHCFLGSLTNGIIINNSCINTGLKCSKNPAEVYCHGFYINGDNITFINNYFLNASGFGINSHRATNVLISNNKFIDGGGSTNGGGLGFSYASSEFDPSWDLTNITIDSNIFENNTITLYLKDIDKLVVRNNLITGSNGYGINLATDNIAGANRNYALNPIIEHNTFFNNLKTDMRFNEVVNGIVRNNLINKTVNYNPVVEVKSSSFSYFGNNFYKVNKLTYGSNFLVNSLSLDFIDFQGFGFDINSLHSFLNSTLDPLFALNSNIILRGNSPAIDVGYNSNLDHDIFGTTRPKGNGYDIGAFENLSETSQAVCGNNVKEGLEECDGINFGIYSGTCSNYSFQYSSGNLICNSCSISTTSCLTTVCGDAQCSNGESCSSCSQDCGVCQTGIGSGTSTASGSGGPIESSIIVNYINKTITFSGIILNNDQICNACDISFLFEGNIVSVQTNSEGKFNVIFENITFKSGISLLQITVQNKTYQKEIYIP